jgi:selenide,water dikinase
MAIAILGWPVNVLPPELAGEVVRGAQQACLEAGIPLAGGHSIDAPEPIFGLAVTGMVETKHIKKNGGAHEGDVLFLTKPLGIGILTTAQKKEKLLPQHEHLAPEVMLKLNSIGETLGKIQGVHAMTDITGFGLAGHLLEMCQASEITAIIRFRDLPVIDPAVYDYIREGCIPGGTNRNYNSFKTELDFSDLSQKELMCDPQTSGGLLIAVDPASAAEVSSLLAKENLFATSIGRMSALKDKYILVQ